jgi:hypothetical protein
LLLSIGCALLLLSSVAVGSALAAAAKPATDRLSPGNQQLGESLVVPSVDELLSGEQAQLARTARRSAPAAVARRAASRSAFEGLSARAVIGDAKQAFPSLIGHTAGGTPQLSSGERVVHYWRGPGSRKVRTAADPPGRQPVDLAL